MTIIYKSAGNTGIIPQGDWERALVDPSFAVAFFDDFLDSYPANGTAIGAGTKWTKAETAGNGAINALDAFGAIKLSLGTGTQIALAEIYSAFTFDPANYPLIFEARVAIYDIGDNAAVDINFGMAEEAPGADADDTVSAFFHFDGNDLSIKCECDDDTNETAATDTTLDAVDNTYAVYSIDMRDLSDIKFYVNGVRVLEGTTFSMADLAVKLGPVFTAEKTSNDSPCDVYVDWVKVIQYRS